MDALSQGLGPFGPRAAAQMAGAFQAALMIASDEGSPYAVLPARELRRQLARAIVRERRHGNTDVDQLKARALRLVAAALPQVSASTDNPRRADVARRITSLPARRSAP